MEIVWIHYAIANFIVFFLPVFSVQSKYLCLFAAYAITHIKFVYKNSGDHVFICSKGTFVLIGM